MKGSVIWKMAGKLVGQHRAVSATPETDMRHVADAELKTVGAARRIDGDRCPLPKLGMKAQCATVEDDAAHPRGRGSFGRFGGCQQILRTHTDGAGLARDRRLAGFGLGLQYQVACRPCRGIATAGDSSCR